jgi:hypothetical protein
MTLRQKDRPVGLPPPPAAPSMILALTDTEPSAADRVGRRAGSPHDLAGTSPILAVCDPETLMFAPGDTVMIQDASVGETPGQSFGRHLEGHPRALLDHQPSAIVWR